MHIVPYGDRILVKRRPVGEKIGKSKIIFATDTMKGQPTDLADVKFVPDHSFFDKELIENSETIIKNLTTKAMGGDSDALIALLRLNEYLSIKAIKKGDKVMISKYVGIDFSDGLEDKTIVKGCDVIGIIVED